MGEIAVACALGYMELRDISPSWRDDHPALGGWYQRMGERASFAETAPIPD
jgi:glutathione S-transferase